MIEHNVSIHGVYRIDRSLIGTQVLIFKCPVQDCRENHLDPAVYPKGQMPEEPKWHTWVYGGAKRPNG